MRHEWNSCPSQFRILLGCVAWNGEWEVPCLAKEARHGAPRQKSRSTAADRSVRPTLQQVPSLRRRWRSGFGRDDRVLSGLIPQRLKLGSFTCAHAARVELVPFPVSDSFGLCGLER